MSKRHERLAKVWAGVKAQAYLGLALCTLWPMGALALDRVPRPMANPALVAPVAPAAAPQTETARPSAALGAVARPRVRANGKDTTENFDWLTANVAGSSSTDATKGKSPSAGQGAGAGLGATPRPAARPRGLAAAPASAPKGGARNSSTWVEPPTDFSPKNKSREPASAKGSVCGVAAIKGEKIAPITSRVQGCGLANGVKVTAVSGVRLSMPITVDCNTAKALNTWVERAAQPAYGGKIVELKIAGSYTCRPRNNKKGAKISEHGRGGAVDVAGFKLSNGKTHLVLRGFDKTMRAAHKGACGIFGTTLGPGSDGFHEDHLHFDTARQRNGAYCR